MRQETCGQLQPIHVHELAFREVTGARLCLPRLDAEAVRAHIFGGTEEARSACIRCLATYENAARHYTHFIAMNPDLFPEDMQRTCVSRLLGGLTAPRESSPAEA